MDISQFVGFLVWLRARLLMIPHITRGVIADAMSTLLTSQRKLIFSFMELKFHNSRI